MSWLLVRTLDEDVRCTAASTDYYSFSTVIKQQLQHFRACRSLITASPTSPVPPALPRDHTG
jgi:hypothetical protein